MLRKSTKISFTFLLVVTLIVSSSFAVFAANEPTLDLQQLEFPLEQAVLITPNGEELLIDNGSLQISAENVQMLENNSLNMKASTMSTIRNNVWIKQNTTTPLFSDAEGNIYTSNVLTLSESYYNLTSSEWMSVPLATKNNKLDIISSNGYTPLDIWYTTCSYQVESNNPVSVTYRINGTEYTDSISNGSYTIGYYTEANSSAIWSGHLTYIQNGSYGTTLFNGGANFLTN